MLVRGYAYSVTLFESHHYAGNASSGASRRRKCGARLLRAVKAAVEV
jgi:hypothetical protein